MRAIRRWFGIPRGANPREGDPYLESLARQLLLLRTGEMPRQAISCRAARGGH